MAEHADDLTPVEDAVRDLDETYILCRDVHHSWRVDGYRTSGRGAVERTLVCDRCGTERVDEWTLRGVRVAAHYRYPDGYQFKRVDMTDDPRMVLRREVLRRAGVGGTTKRKGRK